MTQSEFVLPVQVSTDQGRAEIVGGLGQSEGEDGVLQASDDGGAAFRHHGIKRVEEQVDVRIIHCHLLLLHLL